MNKERYNQIIESAWKKYGDSHFIPGNPNGKLRSEQLMSVIPMMHNRETFRAEILKNPRFARKWGLKIEERELNDDARNIFFLAKMNPTKLIKITYNNETIEIYE